LTLKALKGVRHFFSGGRVKGEKEPDPLGATGFD